MEYFYNESKANHVINFIEKFCVHPSSTPTGISAGDPFLLLDWQKEEIRRIYGWYDKDGNRQTREVFVYIPKKNGKALHIDTKLPTPNGFITMNDVKEGDIVYSGDGKPTKVLFATDVMHKQSYRIEFSDGSSMIACEDHLWEIGAYESGRNAGERYTDGESIRRMVRDTNWIKDNLFARKNTTTPISNCYITIDHKIDKPDVDLPIDPYTLGVWLGDGTTGYNNYTGHSDDSQIADEIRKGGHTVDKLKTKYSWTIDRGKLEKVGPYWNNSFKCRLRELGILNAKRIPEIYMQASWNQRLALLQGLMDTDGYVAKSGQIDFVQKSKSLAMDVFTLARSLGILANNFKRKKAKISDRFVGYYYHFCIRTDHSVFRLHRKAIRQRKPRNERRIFINAVIDVGIQPVKCIGVDNERHTYLAGESYIKTHNSSMGAALALYHLVADGEFNAEVISVASSREQAAILFDIASKIVDMSPLLSKILVVQRYAIIFPATKSQYKVYASKAGTIKGRKPSCVLFDELYEVDDGGELYRQLKGGQIARKNPMFISFTTAGALSPTNFCYKLWEQSHRWKKGLYTNDHFYAKLFEPDEGDDWRDESTWLKCNPSLGDSYPLDALRAEFIEAQQLVSKEIYFKVYYLNIWVGAMDVWISDSNWMNCYDSSVKLEDFAGEECIIGLDLAATNDLTAMVALFKKDKKVYLFPYFFIPEETVTEMAKRNKADYISWITNGELLTTPGPRMDYEALALFIESFGKKYKIKTVALDEGFQGAAIANMLGAKDIHVTTIRTNLRHISNATKEFESLIAKGQLVHTDNACMRWNVGNAIIYTDSNGNIRLDKKKSRNKVDGVMASIVGMYMIDLLSEPESAPFYILSG